jgi:hypothetical protein
MGAPIVRPARLQIDKARQEVDIVIGRGRRDAPKDLPFRWGPRSMGMAPHLLPWHSMARVATLLHSAWHQVLQPTTICLALPPRHPLLRSREAKKVFEAALMESRRMSMSFITCVQSWNSS